MPENFQLPESKMSLIILKRDLPIWYAKNDGKLLRMLNRGRQIDRIMKRDDHLTRIYQGEGHLKALWMERQIGKIVSSLNKGTIGVHPTMSMVRIISFCSLI